MSSVTDKLEEKYYSAVLYDLNEDYFEEGKESISLLGCKKMKTSELPIFEVSK